ncbi:hypothetical protein [Streptomyces sp. NPDC050504]|uniref:hypothetical protein n=1 Tax=Streptomyces sp. NPDC050504 TaxID=3365618 RepID=UPI0037B0915F
MNKRLRNLAVTLAGALAATGLSTVTATPAAADGCPWPYVCFAASGGGILTMYKDTGYQTTSAKTRTAKLVYNARREDCVGIYLSGGSFWVLPPGTSFSTSEPVVALNITYGCP